MPPQKICPGQKQREKVISVCQLDPNDINLATHNIPTCSANAYAISVLSCGVWFTRNATYSVFVAGCSDYDRCWRIVAATPGDVVVLQTVKINVEHSSDELCSYDKVQVFGNA